MYYFCLFPKPYLSFRETKGIELNKFNEKIEPITHSKIIEFLKEDVGAGDITTDAIIGQDIEAKAVIICHEDAIVSGLLEAIQIFNLLDCSANSLINEGDSIKKESPILKIQGKAQSILKCERTALNILGRMSGVATETSRIVEEAVKWNKDIIIASTRKTQPGFRIFDKKAVKSGGGDTHRYRLDDAVLIKDNHLKIIGSISSAVRTAKKNVSFTKKIEVEVSTIEETIEAIEAGADIVLLDNMKPQDISIIVRTLEKKQLRKKIFLEASGGINMKNIKKYSETGIDAISLGVITHSAKNINFSLDII